MAYIFSDRRQRDTLVILGLALGTLILWRIPTLGFLFYPFQLFGTFVHEISHGMAAIITGGTFQRFAVNPDLSGVAWSAGGVRWVVTSAGYIGSAAFGGVLVLLATWGVPPRRILLGLGAALGLLCLLFVRNLFGIAVGLGLAALLVGAAGRLPPRWAGLLVLFLAVQLMLDGLNSLLGLIQLSSRSAALTDAQIMARATGVPALVWALVWTVVSVAILGATLQLAYRRG